MATKNECCCCNCGEGSNRQNNMTTPIIGEFIAALECNRNNLGEVSERQMLLYDKMIEILNLSRRDTSMSMVRNLFNYISNSMECGCCGDGGNRTYRLVFRMLSDLLTSLEEKEMFMQFEKKRQEREDPEKFTCWGQRGVHNRYFGERTRPIYEKTVAEGLMHADYSWADNTTKQQIATWIDLFTTHFGVSKQWMWANEIWELESLAYVLSQCKCQPKYQPSLSVVHKIFSEL